MKILLDENLPIKLRVDFGENHEVYTVQYMGWSGKKSGKLLGLMVFHGFDVLVTLDKNIQFQQNIDKFPIQYFILDANENKIDTLQPYITELKRVLEEKIEEKITLISV